MQRAWLIRPRHGKKFRIVDLKSLLVRKLKLSFLSKNSRSYSLIKMAGAVFGSVELLGVSCSFQARLYDFARTLALEEGFGRNVKIGGHYVEVEVESDLETDVSPSFGNCPPIVVVDSDVESVIVLDDDDEALGSLDGEDVGVTHDAETQFQVFNE